MRQVVFTDKAPKPTSPYSQGISLGSNNLIFTAGQLGLAPETGQLVKGGMEEQTLQALKNIQAVLQAAGSNLENVVKVTVLLSDINNFGIMNKIYAQFFNDNPPARTAFEAGRLPLDALVEIEAIAVVEQ